MRYKKNSSSSGVFRLLLLALGVLLMVAEAEAQDARSRREASRFFELGEQHLSQCNYDEAIKNFQEAYRIAPHHVVYYYLGLAHHRSGFKVEALHYFRRYLRTVKQEGVRDQETQMADVRQIVDQLAEDLRAEAKRERGRVHREELHASVASLLDELVHEHGEAVAAPYLRGYVEVVSREIGDPSRVSSLDSIAALEGLEESLRAELARSPTEGSRALRVTGIALTTAGLISVGVGVGYGIQASRRSEMNSEGAALKIVGYGGAGFVAAALGWGIYRHGKAKRKPPLLHDRISISPGRISSGSGAFVTGRF